MKKDALLNISGSVVPAIIGLVSIPFLISHLQIERFGILTIMWAVVGAASLFDFGLGRIATLHVSKKISSNQNEDIFPIIKTILYLTAFVGGVFGFSIVIFSNGIANNILRVNQVLLPEVKLSIIIVGLAVPLTTISNGYRGVLEAYRKFAHVNLAKIITGTAIFLYPLLWLSAFGGGLVEASLMLLFARVSGLVVFYYFYIRLPIIRCSGRAVPFSERINLLKSGFWMSISSIASPALVYLDRFVISSVMGAAFVAYYTVPFEVIIRILIVPGAIGASLLPRLSGLYLSSPEWAKILYFKSLIYVALIMAFLCVVSGFIAHPLLVHFLSAEFAEKSMWVAIILLVGVFFNGVANIPYTALHATGAEKFTGILHSLELLLYIPVLVFFVRFMGIEGAALAWAARSFFDFLIMVLRRPL